MKTIFKYPVHEKEVFKIELPVGSQFLKCDLQRGFPKMWIEQPVVFSEVEMRCFVIHGTGWNIPENHRYLGTYQSEYQTFVWHLYEVRK